MSVGAPTAPFSLRDSPLLLGYFESYVCGHKSKGLDCLRLYIPVRRTFFLSMWHDLHSLLDSLYPPDGGNRLSSVFPQLFLALTILHRAQISTVGQLPNRLRITIGDTLRRRHGRLERQRGPEFGSPEPLVCYARSRPRSASDAIAPNGWRSSRAADQCSARQTAFFKALSMIRDEFPMRAVETLGRFGWPRLPLKSLPANLNCLGRISRTDGAGKSRDVNAVQSHQGRSW